MPRFLEVGYLLVLAAAVVGPGCQYVPKREFVAVQNHNHSLIEQSRAQATEIENLKVHARNLSEQLISAEGELAALEKPRDRRWADRTGAGTEQTASPAPR
jgi:hypothetical protein